MSIAAAGGAGAVAGAGRAGGGGMGAPAGGGGAVGGPRGAAGSVMRLTVRRVALARRYPGASEDGVVPALAPPSLESGRAAARSSRAGALASRGNLTPSVQAATASRVRTGRTRAVDIGALAGRGARGMRQPERLARGDPLLRRPRRLRTGVPFLPRRYSSRSTTIGSTRDARRAGDRKSTRLNSSS